jgi:hypothetical protein
MSYIGRGVDAISNVEKLDNITFNGSSSYSLLKGGVAFTPVGQNNILISIDGVVQMGNFSVSTTSIAFDWSPTSSNTCDWIMHFGTGLVNTLGDQVITSANMGANSVDSASYVDGSIDTAHIDALQVTGAKLNTDVISAQTALAAEPADTDEFMVSDGGVLKRIDYSLIKGGGITAASQWRLTTSFTGEADTMDSNLEEVDTDGGGVIGTSMTESSGIFTFPSTGYWLITFTLSAYNGASFDYSTGIIMTTINNSSYDEAANCDTNIVYVGSQTPKNSATTSFLFDVTSTTNCKVHFKVGNSTGGAIGTTGDTAKNTTYFTFVRLGDT